MALRTRLTERLGLEHPIVSAPMAFAAGGRLATAVSQAGGLGLIGGGYGDPEWLDRQFGEAGNARVGCGFITWALAERPVVLDRVIARAPAAIMLSFGTPTPFAKRIKDAGIVLICQVQSLAQAREAAAAGADIVVAQGGEAGGHSAQRGTLTLVPEIADYLAEAAPETLLLGAGGIADGRGLAAALMLGADGVLMGSRLWASPEAVVAPSFHAAALAADGDATIRTTIVDRARNLDWPHEYPARVLRRGFVTEWHGRDEALEAPGVKERETERFAKAWQAGDVDNSAVFIGENVGLIRDIAAPGDIVVRVSREAEMLLADRAAALAGRGR